MRRKRKKTEYLDDWDIVEKKECHGVLRCDYTDCNARYWDRDVNAVINTLEFLKSEVLGRGHIHAFRRE
ncbi:hypothetical protein GQ600_3321 [Phytophthora cactorum]|nr:hypothetical protein GQ600_3321 [Phytophthora cactorum]